MTDFVKMRELIRQEEHYRWAVERQMAKATRTTAPLSKAGVSGSGKTGSQVEEGAVMLAEIRGQYDEILSELESMRSELKTSIGKLRSQRQRLDKTCLRMRYIQGIKVRKIAEALCYSEDYIFQRLKKAEILIHGIQREAEAGEKKHIISEKS